MSQARSRLVPEPEAVRLLSQYGVPYPEHGLARSVDDAVRVAESIGYPVVLKVVSPDLVHKSAAGGVITNLGDAEAVREGYRAIVHSVRGAVAGARIEGVLVCRQAPEAFEVIVGGLRDPTFGPTVMFGRGGVHAEVHRDVVFRVAPLELRDAEDMIREMEAYPLLAGAGGRTGYDLQDLGELLMTVSRLCLLYTSDAADE